MIVTSVYLNPDAMDGIMRIKNDNENKAKFAWRKSI